MRLFFSGSVTKHFTFTVCMLAGRGRDLSLQMGKLNEKSVPV
jgi:hypothetical protein